MPSPSGLHPFAFDLPALPRKWEGVVFYFEQHDAHSRPAAHHLGEFEKGTGLNRGGGAAKLTFPRFSRTIPSPANIAHRANGMLRLPESISNAAAEAVPNQSGQ